LNDQLRLLLVFAYYRLACIPNLSSLRDKTCPPTRQSSPSTDGLLQLTVQRDDVRGLVHLAGHSSEQLLHSINRQIDLADLIVAPRDVVVKKN
jgi:hypothetical protein